MIQTFITALIITVLALPAQAHTEAEQREWKTEWVDRVRLNGGLSRTLLTELLDFEERHVPPPPPVVRAPSSSTGSAHRGMGGNVEQWRGLVAIYFPSEVDRALCIMAHESGGNPNARNPSSGAAGLFQVMPFWWEHYGGDRYNPETNVRVASLIRSQQGWTAWSPWNRGACR